MERDDFEDTQELETDDERTVEDEVGELSVETTEKVIHVSYISEAEARCGLWGNERWR
ncbi:uncharacterized protein HfgLR_13020 [Haloferax gibbonsii]|uniref:Uncharacterized protein n=1 Tax=Haloferax gibbonsii TaxID=35746 RepID=A0A871BI97_HALGI|nr:hypothetical protein [Haloferax gibbonsii]QOS12732.1 uncharacterized protein HfgLR_13020 [Haloferax gibbonsii]